MENKSVNACKAKMNKLFALLDKLPEDVPMEIACIQAGSLLSARILFSSGLENLAEAWKLKLKRSREIDGHICLTVELGGVILAQVNDVGEE